MLKKKNKELGDQADKIDEENRIIKRELEILKGDIADRDKIIINAEA